MIVVPFVAGAVHETVTVLFPLTTVGLAGAVGTAAGTISVEAADAGDVPTAFLAFTVKK